MRRSRIGIRRRQRKVTLVLAIFFLIILPMAAVTIGKKITQLLVVPTINTNEILKPPGGDIEEFRQNENNIDQNTDTEIYSNEEKEEEDRVENRVIRLSPLSVYMIQIASLSNTSNIEKLSEELKEYGFPHIVYAVDNQYKIYVFGATDRRVVEDRLDRVREVYPDSFISEIHLPEKQINYSADDKLYVEETVENLNSLIELLKESSEILYNFNNQEGKIGTYREVLLQQEEILKELAEKTEKNWGLEAIDADNIGKMIQHYRSNIQGSLEVVDSQNNTYMLQSQFLDSLFRTVETIKK